MNTHVLAAVAEEYRADLLRAAGCRTAVHIHRRHVHPEVVQVMRELGIDLAERHPEVKAIRDDIAGRVRQLLAELDRSGSLGAAR